MLRPATLEEGDERGVGIPHFAGDAEVRELAFDRGIHARQKVRGT